jgi:hypothetical protein
MGHTNPTERLGATKMTLASTYVYCFVPWSNAAAEDPPRCGSRDGLFDRSVI